MELIVKINNGPSSTSYKDGDIVQAFSMRDIYFCHAQHKCHVKNFPLNPVTGLRTPDPLLIKFLEKINTYKFQRVNSNEVVRTNLITEEQDTVSPTPNSTGEYLHPYKYISNQLKRDRHLIFGSSGLEYWYGKERVDIDIDAVWNDIETHTDFLKSDHTFYPLSSLEKRKFLPLNCCSHVHDDHHDHHEDECLSGECSCDRSECNIEFITERISSIFTVENEGLEGEYNNILHKRKFQVPYWDFVSSLSTNVDDIRNPNREVDLRKVLDLRSDAGLLTIDKVVAGVV